MRSDVAFLLRKYFGGDVHPYEQLAERVRKVARDDAVIVDAGCGRTAPVLRQFASGSRRLIGVDLVDFEGQPDGIELHQGDIGQMPLPDGSVDIVYARSVMEHVDDPEAVYKEVARVLKPGGHFIFLTPNFWDYASLIAWVIPNRFHGRIVRMTEGRDEMDVFPTRYRSNTRRAITRLASLSRLRLEEFTYLGQYPAYFVFSPWLFRLASHYELTLRRFPRLKFLQGWILASLNKPSSGI
ncbi:MAG: class I SAM-dependent methyltransferase [Alphaproteobacteria bacterium]|nr:class I SAM-dependent methyltransferase [Alphaproteobacteria bacterium]